MADKDASILFSSWILLVQIASKSTPRGTLIRGDGTPHTDVSLTLKCRCPDAWMTLALKWFPENTDWIEVQEFACERQSGVTLTSVGRHLPAKEEGIGGEGKKGGDGKDWPTQLDSGPSLEICVKWLKAANTSGADYTEGEVKSAWLALNASGWMWGRNPVKDYRSAIERQIQTDRQRTKPNGKYYGTQTNSLNPAADRRNAGTIGKTDYGAAGRKLLERQAARLASESAGNETSPPTA